MRRAYFISYVAITLGSLMGNAWAIDYRSVTTPSILYDGPSAQSPKLFIIAPMTPLEVVVTTEKWIKVRDAAGTLAWIEPQALSSKHTVIVTAPSTSLKAQPQDNAQTLLTTGRDSVFELVSSTPNNGWVNVRSKNTTGYVRINDIWGL